MLYPSSSLSILLSLFSIPSLLDPGVRVRPGSGCAGQEAERHTSAVSKVWVSLSTLSSFPVRYSPQVASEGNPRACGFLETSIFTLPDNNLMLVKRQLPNAA